MLSLNHSTCQQLSLQHPLQLQSQPLSFWAGSSLSIDESRHLYRLLPPSSHPLLRILTKCIVLDERCEMSFYVQSHAFSIPVCFFSPGLPYHSHWPHLPILVISPYLLNNIGEIACETDSGLNVLISKCAAKNWTATTGIDIISQAIVGRNQVVVGIASHQTAGPAGTANPADGASPVVAGTVGQR
eukprot:scaffold7679_cov96-Skeletonema_marinoi.AAC.3